MESTLDIEVGYAPRLDGTYTTANLLHFLTDPTHADQVHRIRGIEDKDERDRLKKQLPVITASGIFSGRATMDNLVRHTGLMAIDIDGKDNPQYPDAATLRDACAAIPEVAYAGLSASGRGCFLLIPIKYPEHHLAHFSFIEAYFAKEGVKIDAKCWNINRLRFYSYDPEAKFRHDARPLENWTPPQPKQSPPKKAARPSGSGDTWNQVNQIVQQVEARKIDLTNGYDNWLKIAFALADEFREDGRDLFHRISSIYPGYDPGEADRQYTNCIKGRGTNKVTIATLFHYAKAAGVSVKQPPVKYAEIRKPGSLSTHHNAHKAPAASTVPVTRREIIHSDHLTYLSETQHETGTIVTVKDRDGRVIKIPFNLETGEPATPTPEWIRESGEDWKPATYDGQPCVIAVMPEIMPEIAQNAPVLPGVVIDPARWQISQNKPELRPKYDAAQQGLENSLKEDWSHQIAALELFFQTASIPDDPIQFDGCGTITDAATFIESHLTTLRANNGKRTFLPFLDRLEDLADRIHRHARNDRDIGA